MAQPLIIRRRHRTAGPLLTLWAAALATLALIAVPLVPASAVAGEIRIRFSDGNSLQVPYCWEEEGQIKFEMPGGIVGIPKAQVTSIEEVIASKPFSPDAMSQREEVYLKLDDDQRRRFKDFMLERTPRSDAFTTLNPEQVNRLLERRAELHPAGPSKATRVYTSSLERTGEFAEWVRLADGNILLLLNNAVSSAEELAGKTIMLTLFDGEGERIKQVRCTVHSLKDRQAEIKELGLAGWLYAVVAAVEPDPRIKRYELTTLR